MKNFTLVLRLLTVSGIKFYIVADSSRNLHIVTLLSNYSVLSMSPIFGLKQANELSNKLVGAPLSKSDESKLVQYLKE